MLPVRGGERGDFSASAAGLDGSRPRPGALARHNANTVHSLGH